jgi:hypothetical protein
MSFLLPFLKARISGQRLPHPPLILRPKEGVRPAPHAFLSSERKDRVLPAAGGPTKYPRPDHPQIILLQPPTLQLPNPPSSNLNLRVWNLDLLLPWNLDLLPSLELGPSALLRLGPSLRSAAQGWYTRTGSNRRPSRCKRDALPLSYSCFCSLGTPRLSAQPPIPASSEIPQPRRLQKGSGRTPSFRLGACPPAEPSPASPHQGPPPANPPPSTFNVGRSMFDVPPLRDSRQR